MKLSYSRFVKLIITLTIAASGAACTTNDSSAHRSSRSELARVTVYWTNSDRWTKKHQSSTGTRLRPGHCAVDPHRIPYGSRVVFPDGGVLDAVDTGSAVISRKAARLSGHTSEERSAIVVDRFFETKREALRWAGTHELFQKLQIVTP